MAFDSLLDHQKCGDVGNDELMIINGRRIQNGNSLDELPALTLGPLAGEGEELLDRQLILRREPWPGCHDNLLAQYNIIVAYTDPVRTRGEPAIAVAIVAPGR